MAGGGGMNGKGMCMARGMHGMGHVWEACMAGGHACGGWGYAWRVCVAGGMCGQGICIEGHA